MTQEERNRVLDLLDVINDWRRTGRPDLARILAAIERLEPYLLPTNEGANPPWQAGWGSYFLIPGSME